MIEIIIPLKVLQSMLKEKNSSKKPSIVVSFARHTHLSMKKKYFLQMFF